MKTTLSKAQIAQIAAEVAKVMRGNNSPVVVTGKSIARKKSEPQFADTHEYIEQERLPLLTAWIRKNYPVRHPEITGTRKATVVKTQRVLRGEVEYVLATFSAKRDGKNLVLAVSPKKSVYGDPTFVPHWAPKKGEFTAVRK